MIEQTCNHCRGAKYVFEYWLEKILGQNGIHLTEIPSEIFKMIPSEYLTHCHCNIGLFLRKKHITTPYCSECVDATWRFTEEAEQNGYRWKKVLDLSVPELIELPCEYFERCPCGQDDQGKKPPEKRKILQTLSDLLKIPRLAFNPFI